MPHYFYTDANGQKQGPCDDQQLKTLIGAGVIGPHTPLETEGGHTGQANQIPGLFAATPPPVQKQLFCTNCGSSVTEQAVACMSCGAKPVGYRKFCRHCGTGLNPGQVICTKCGSGISGTTGTSATQSAPQHLFCTNCGSSVSGQTVACMSCGAKPVGHRKFCRQCGTKLNPEQVICTQCGAAINTIGVGLLFGGSTNPLVGFSVGDMTVLGATVLAFLSFFLPWEDIGLATANAFRSSAFIIGGSIFVYPVWKVLTQKTIHPFGGYLCATIGVCYGIYYAASCQLSLGPGFGESSANYAGTGVYLFIFACVALYVGIVLQRRAFQYK